MNFPYRQFPNFDPRITRLIENLPAPLQGIVAVTLAACMWLAVFWCGSTLAAVAEGLLP